MQTIELDGGDWRSELDFYEALANALGSVEWHGRNADAFLETMIYYLDLNKVQPPYKVVIKRAREPVLSFLLEFASWIVKARDDRKRDWGDDAEVVVTVEHAAP
ncbi:MAG: barstar family protein [Sphingobium sp.]|nr:barstar family protein [Sphingobium sp.]